MPALPHLRTSSVALPDQLGRHRPSAAQFRSMVKFATGAGKCWSLPSTLATMSCFPAALRARRQPRNLPRCMPVHQQLLHELTMETTPPIPNVHGGAHRGRRLGAQNENCLRAVSSKLAARPRRSHGRRAPTRAPFAPRLRAALSLSLSPPNVGYPSGAAGESLSAAARERFGVISSGRPERLDGGRPRVPQRLERGSFGTSLVNGRPALGLCRRSVRHQRLANRHRGSRASLWHHFSSKAKPSP